MPIYAICDDQEEDMKELACMIQEWGTERNQTDLRLQCFSSPYALLEAVEKGADFDLFLLDILMPEMTGIALGEHLRQLLVDPLLIFITSSEDYYPDAFRLYAFQYFCKPLQKDSLFPALDKAASNFSERENDVFLFKMAGNLTRILLRSIVYVELQDHVCHFYLEDGQHMKSQYLRTSFDGFVAPLLKNKRFIKTHISYVVNLDFICRVSSTALVLTTGKEIPIARSFAQKVHQRYVAYGLREESLS